MRSVLKINLILLMSLFSDPVKNSGLKESPSIQRVHYWAEVFERYGRLVTVPLSASEF